MEAEPEDGGQAEDDHQSVQPVAEQIPSLLPRDREHPGGLGRERGEDRELEHRPDPRDAGARIRGLDVERRQRQQGHRDHHPVQPTFPGIGDGTIAGRNAADPDPDRVAAGGALLHAGLRHGRRGISRPRP